MDSKTLKRPYIIGVTGAHSGAGKTTCAERVVSILRKAQKTAGAVKYTRTELYASLIEDDPAIETQGKDTERLSAAGASEVLWLKSPKGEELSELVGMALDRLWHLDAIVIEGNSAAQEARPDVIIFVYGPDPEELKPGARKAMSLASALVFRSFRHSASIKSEKEKFVFDNEIENREFEKWIITRLEEHDQRT